MEEAEVKQRKTRGLKSDQRLKEVNPETFYLKFYSPDAERYFLKCLGEVDRPLCAFFHTFNLKHIYFHISFRHLCHILDSQNHSEIGKHYCYHGCKD